MRTPCWLTGKQRQQASKQTDHQHHAIHIDMQHIRHSIKLNTISVCLLSFHFYCFTKGSCLAGKNDKVSPIALA